MFDRNLNAERNLSGEKARQTAEIACLFRCICGLPPLAQLGLLGLPTSDLRTPMGISDRSGNSTNG
jgi:hypothetical protein